MRDAPARTARRPIAIGVVWISVKRVRWVSLLVGLAALVLLVRIGIFMVDVSRTDLSIQPDDRWRREHSCLTAYAEAARLAAEPGRNVYDASLYEQRFIRGLKVDTYHYPPPFLLLPDALQRTGGGFLGLRPIWFVMQLGVLVAMILAIVRWLGKRDGGAVLLAAPLFFIAPTTLFTFQMGNFQPTAVALSILGMIALGSSRVHVQAVGGVSLAFATLAKVFPGVLGVVLIVTRRWRAAMWTAAAGVVLVLVALAIYGTGPFEDFIHYQLPRLDNGDAFPQSERPNVVAANQSFYGMLVKLRVLGIDALDKQTGLSITSVYGAIVMGLAAVIGWFRRGVLTSPAHRVVALHAWLALLNLASFRSPFVGGPYGAIGTVLLAVLAIACATTARERIAWCAAYVFLVANSLILPTPVGIPSTAMLAFTLASQVIILAINAVPLLRVWRTIPSVAPSGRGEARAA